MPVSALIIVISLFCVFTIESVNKDKHQSEITEACLMENEELSYKEARVACKKDKVFHQFLINTENLSKKEADVVRKIARHQNVSAQSSAVK